MRHALLLLTFASCTSSGTEPDTCAIGDAEATIVSSTVRDQYLQLDIEHAGGCDAHQYALRWSGLAIDIQPRLLPMSLEHFGNGDSCEALLRKTVWFDLTPLTALLAPGDHASLSISMLPLSRTHAQAYTVPQAQGAPPPEGASMLQVCEEN